MDSREVGTAGETLAARWLRSHGYNVVAANYHCRFGEIDIIAADAQYIAFVEVKTRAPQSMTTPREAVTPAKQRRLLKTAMFYLQANPSALQPRFDVMEVITDAHDPMKVISVNFIENAYEAGDLHEAF